MSTTDKYTILKVVQAEAIDYIITYTSAPAAPTSANAFYANIASTILWIIVKWRLNKQFSIISLKVHCTFGWKLLISSLIGIIYNELRQLIIGKKYSLSDLAQYNQVKTFSDLI